MRCPHCQTEHLVRSERSGIETDYCPECRKWLDRHELQRETQDRLRKHGETHSVTDTRPPVPPDPRNQH